jgi:hypothetical protein
MRLPALSLAALQKLSGELDKLALWSIRTFDVYVRRPNTFYVRYLSCATRMESWVIDSTCSSVCAV